MNFSIFSIFIQPIARLFMVNNMKKILPGLIFLMISCSPIDSFQYYDPPMRGMLFTKVRYSPRSMRMNTIGEGKLEKTGRSCSWTVAYLSYFWLETGGGSVQRAARDAGITKIGVVDKEITTILGSMVMRECNIVMGE